MVQEVKAISVPHIQRAHLTITIESLSSLISNRFSEKAIEQMLRKQMKKAAVAREAKDPEADYQASIYYTEDGKPGFPASAIKKACVHACRFLEMRMTEARGAFFVMGEILPVDGEPRMREDVVRLPNGHADIRYRAEYPEWSITFEVLYNPRIISAEGIVNLVETAGFHIGIGDWRAESKNGTHGMFRVTRE